LRHGTNGFTSPLKEFVLRIFIALKNASSSAEFEPANLGLSGKHTNHYTTEAMISRLREANLRIETVIAMSQSLQKNSTQRLNKQVKKKSNAAVLQRRNLINSFISYQSLLSEFLS
jgi:hypothetical protein